MTTVQDQPAHSPLGGSGAERWMKCVGSVALIKELKLPETTDEPDYREHGVAAHEVGAKCLTYGQDAWEFIGERFNKVELDADMAIHVQTYVDEVRPLLARKSGPHGIEYPFFRPEFHHDFYGTSDLWVLLEDNNVLDITDFKYGEGLVVEVEGNPQGMYYAKGILLDLAAKGIYPNIVRIRIVQPRITWHPDGIVRVWETSADEINAWATDVLKPAMDATMVDHDLDAGPHCRFCPAKLVCPLLTSLFGAAARSNPKDIIALSDESLGRSYPYAQAVEFYVKALKDETLRRALIGRKCGPTKLVYKKANRVYREGAETVFKGRLGPEAYTEPKLKSPAEMEKVSADAKELVHEWAFTPKSGFTIALADDRRVEVVLPKASETFKHALEASLEATEPVVALLPPEPVVSEEERDAALDIPAFLRR